MLNNLYESGSALGDTVHDCPDTNSRYSMTYQNRRFPSDEVKRSYGDLMDLMENKKMYLDPALTLDSLARRMEIHRNTLSLLVNYYCGVNFNDFMNRYRVREVKRLIAELMQKKMFVKMWRIYVDAGFHSPSTFYRAFRKIAGCTPFEYKSRLERTGPVSFVAEQFSELFPNREYPAN